MEVIEAASCEDLVQVRRRLHDAWFELPASGVRFSGGSLILEGVDDRAVRKPARLFGPIAELNVSKAAVRLVIDNVYEVEVSDGAHIGSFDLGGLDFDGECITVTGNVPVEVRCMVSALHVKAEILDELLPAGRSWGVAWKVGQRAR